MTFLDVLGAIVAQFLHAEILPYAVVVTGVLVLGALWKRGNRTERQRKVVLASFLLWLSVPITALLGAAFHFSGPPQERGVTFNEVAAMLTASILPLVVLSSVVLVIFAKGVRLNVIGITGSLVFVLFWFSFLAVCAIVGMCT